MSEAEALRALMDADRWIDRVRTQRSHLPEMLELESVETELRGLAKALSHAQASRDPVWGACAKATELAERLRLREADLASRLGASTASARELGVIQHELDHVRELLGAAEDRELELLIELEPLDDAINAVRSRAQPVAARRAELQRTIAELQVSLDDEVVSLSQSRPRLAAALPGELLGRYEHALGRAGTSGAAQVDAGRCDGCRIALSPLDFDRWKHQAADTFTTCPSCGRLLLP